MCLKRKVLGLAVVVIALSGVVPALAQTGGLAGIAKDENGQPLVGYTLLIERLDIKGIYPGSKTNKKGEYVHIGLPIGNYKVSLQTPTGQTVDMVSQIHVGMGDPTTLDFDMAKVKVQRAKEQAVNPEFQKKLEEKRKEEKQMGSLKEMFDQGSALLNEKRYAEAASVFEQALALAKEKNVPIVLGRLGETYSKAASADTDRDTRKQHQDKALDFYAKAMQANPNDASLHNNLGSLYADMGKTPEAQQEFQKAAELNPAGASGYYYNLGVVLVNKGRMDEAAIALKKSTELDPNNANAFYWYAMALLGKADYKPDGTVVPAPGTIEAFQSYLKLDPKGQWATAAQGSIEQLQGKIPTEYKAQKKKKG